MKSVDCPLCDGKADLIIEKRKRSFRKEEFEIFEHYYRCKKCKNEFTNTEVDEVNTNQVYNQYREKYSIPFPNQLSAARENYDLSAVKMAEILGLGINQYRLYENDEMPTESHGTLLSLVINTKDFRDIVLRKKNNIKKSDKIISHLNSLIDSEKCSVLDIKKLLFNSSIIPNHLTGFTLPDFDKFSNMVLYFIKYASFKTRLNKLLFYSDFAYYKYFGKSISGSEYAAIAMGPVPEQYEFKFGLLANEQIISLELGIIKNKEVEKFNAQCKFKEELFVSTEIELMRNVFDHFKYKKTPEIIELSHNELAWKDNKDGNKLISYLEYAPQLIEL